MSSRLLTRKEIFEKVLPTVEQNLSLVDDVDGKDIVLLLGASQNGKSTAINCFCGVPFRWEKPAPQPGKRFAGVPVLTPGKPFIAPVGTGGKPMTMLPAKYRHPTGLIFIDSRGAGEVSGSADPVGILVSEILTEMMCRVAKSVKVVVIATCGSLDPLSALTPVLTQIGSLLVNGSDTVLWIFNRHKGIKQVNGQDDFDAVFEEIGGLIEKHAEEFQNSGRNQNKPTADELAIISLKNSLDKDQIGYIDPTSSWSVQKTLDQIQHLSPIPIAGIQLHEVASAW
jgi:hypothetical protein